MSPIRRWAVTQLNTPDLMSRYPCGDSNKRIRTSVSTVANRTEKPEEEPRERLPGKHSRDGLSASESAGSTDSEGDEMSWGYRQTGDDEEQEGTTWWKPQEVLAVVEEDASEDEWDEKIKENTTDTVQRWRFDENDQDDDYGTDNESLRSDHSEDSGLHGWRLKAQEIGRGLNSEDAWTVKTDLPGHDVTKTWGLNPFAAESDVRWRDPSPRCSDQPLGSAGDPWVAYPEAADDDKTSRSTSEEERMGYERGSRWEPQQVDVVDDKGEQRRRMDAWVSSIHTYCSSTSDSFDFPPLSFQDNFPQRREQDADKRTFYGFPVSNVSLFLSLSSKSFSFPHILSLNRDALKKISYLVLTSFSFLSQWDLLQFIRGHYAREREN